jgi:tRNA pseudouridine55 synthase
VQKKRAHPPVAWRRVDGVLLVDKPLGLSSNAVLQQAKRLYRAERAGHTGTLDPLATGLLPLCFGQATKFAHMLLDADKTYAATIRFGETTATGDAEGSVLERHRVEFTEHELVTTLRRFVGRIEQIPPRYAALKYRGRNYYEYAREGVDIPRPAREVVVHALALDAWNAPDARVTLRCAKGTYVRALAEDLGRDLGCGAHLIELRRVCSGGFDIAGAIALDALASMTEADRDMQLLPVDALVAALPRLDLSHAEIARFVQGQAIDRRGVEDGMYRAYAAGVFAGIARVEASVARPHRVLVPPVTKAIEPVPALG